MRLVSKIYAINIPKCFHEGMRRTCFAQDLSLCRTRLYRTWFAQDLVDRVLECLTSLEAWHLGRVDGDGFAGLRIVTRAGSTFTQGKRTKTNQRNLIASFHGISDGINKGIQSTTSGRLGQIGPFRNLVYEL